MSGSNDTGRIRLLGSRHGERIPAAAGWLGGNGALPFAIAAGAIWFAPAPFATMAVPVVVVYAAVILSFLGGLVWGAVCAAAAATDEPWSDKSSRLLALSVIPALVGWGATFLPAPYPLLVMAAAILAVLLIDWRLAVANIVPAWWMKLRWRLSLGVAALLLLAAAGVR